MTDLVEDVRRAVVAAPLHFESQTHIEGIDVGDLFALNSLLGGTIEAQVVETLNKLRPIWDTRNAYLDCMFRRYAQSFPDVRLVRQGENRPLLGIELKGWYLLAKEGEPSFRYRVTPAACAEQDLLVVVPWHLKNVLSGTPVILSPFVESARYAAEYRNYWWTYIRETRSDKTIDPPATPVEPYPPPRANIADRPRKDGGGNYGRIARMGLMDAYIDEMLDTGLAGVEGRAWLRFLKLHTEGYNAQEVSKELDQILNRTSEEVAAGRGDRLAVLLREIADLLRSPSDE